MEAVTVELRRLDLSSPVFEHRGFIPFHHTADGDNVNPALDIRFFPAETQSLVVVLEDEDLPEDHRLHWICWNIPPIHKIQENTTLGITGKNSFKEKKYQGPCPEQGTHRYTFKIYALGTMLKLKATATRSEVELMMYPHSLGYGELMGLYKRLSQQLMF